MSHFSPQLLLLLLLAPSLCVGRAQPHSCESAGCIVPSASTSAANRNPFSDAAARDGAGTLIASYTYDPFDRRLSKTLGTGQRTHYLPSPWGLLAEADQAGAVKVVYGWSPLHENGTAPMFAKVADATNTVSGTRYVYYHNDHLGTPQRITDKTGAIVWAADYDAFGRASVRTAPANAVSNPLRYPGQYFDQETGLHYNDRRSYDPDTGRYLTRDPIGLEGGINLYTYAAASPSNFTDPTGEIIPLLALSALRCVAINYGRCMALCMGVSLVGNALADCGPSGFGDMAKDCAVDCIWGMLPIPNPCGKFGKLFSAAVGLASGLMNSFPADTLVHVRPANAGTSSAQAGQAELKPIGELKEGDEVLAFAEWKEPGKRQTDSGDKLDERLSYEKITHVMSSTREQRLVHITLESGERITATDGHPLRTTEGWRDAVLLKKGGQLLLKGSGDADALALDASTRARNQQATATIADVRIETRTVQVFNLEVANAHTFFVGVQGVLAHNAVDANQGGGPSHGGVAHNNRIDTYIERIKKWAPSIDPTTIRKNQWQVRCGGKSYAGRNKPDVQFDHKGKDGKTRHHNREFDTDPRQSVRHQQVITANDPTSVVKGSMVK
jgi:RHS repeat-associated protein